MSGERKRYCKLLHWSYQMRFWCRKHKLYWDLTLDWQHLFRLFMKNDCICFRMPEEPYNTSPANWGAHFLVSEVLTYWNFTLRVGKGEKKPLSGSLMQYCWQRQQPCVNCSKMILPTMALSEKMTDCNVPLEQELQGKGRLDDKDRPWKEKGGSGSKGRLIVDVGKGKVLE